jgi:DNA-binding XRE family transcriptional regulator
MSGESVPSALKHAVGKRLYATRIAIGRELGHAVSADMLASWLGVGRTAFSNWENGENLASVPAMLRLAARFGYTLEWIYAGKIGTLPLNRISTVEAAAAEAGAIVGAPMEETQFAVDRATLFSAPRRAATAPTRPGGSVTIQEPREPFDDGCLAPKRRPEKP